MDLLSAINEAASHDVPDISGRGLIAVELGCEQIAVASFIDLAGPEPVTAFREDGRAILVAETGEHVARQIEHLTIGRSSPFGAMSAGVTNDFALVIVDILGFCVPRIDNCDQQKQAANCDFKRFHRVNVDLASVVFLRQKGSCRLAGPHNGQPANRCCYRRRHTSCRKGLRISAALQLAPEPQVKNRSSNFSTNSLGPGDNSARLGNNGAVFDPPNESIVPWPV